MAGAPPQPAAVAAAAPPPAPAAKSDMAPILQQLNLTALQTRMRDLQNTISRITHNIHTNPSSKWPDVLGQFAMVNVELLSLVDDIKPILKAFVVYPKNVTAATAPILPIMLSSKLLPELEAEEATLKEQVLTPLSNLPLHVQTERLQKQIELVRTVCDTAEKVLIDARKNFGLGARQGLPSLATIDKAQAAKIFEQEKLLYAAANYGEGLRISSDQRNTSVVPPSHIASALASADDGYPRAGGMRPTTPQQIIPGAPMNGAPAAALPYANSPRPGNYNEQTMLMQRSKVQQMQKHLLQQQHLRQPATPPLPQMQVPNQSGPTMLQPGAKMQQFPQNHLQLNQQQHAQLQQHMQEKYHQQQLQLQQLHNNTAQGQLAQGGQMRPQIAAYGNPNSLLSSNMVANMNQAGLSQQGLQQRMQFGAGLGAQPQRNLSSQMLTDPLYMGVSQSAATLGLPLQQQLPGQPNYGLMNPTQNALLNSAPGNIHGSLLNQGGLLNPNAMAFNQARQQQQQQQQPPS